MSAHTQRQMDRQSVRQRAQRQTDREKERQTDRQMGIHKDRANNRSKEKNLDFIWVQLLTMVEFVFKKCDVLSIHGEVQGHGAFSQLVLQTFRSCVCYEPVMVMCTTNFRSHACMIMKEWTPL